jgi:hypothetical protein
MKRTLLACLVLVMAIVPAANGVCGLGCVLDRRGAEPTSTNSTACPLHHQNGAPPVHAPASDRCGHDHAAGRIGLLRVVTDAPQRMIVALTPTVPTPSAREQPAQISRAGFRFTPPDRPSRPLVLRI